MENEKKDLPNTDSKPDKVEESSFVNAANANASEGVKETPVSKPAEPVQQEEKPVQNEIRHEAPKTQKTEPGKELRYEAPPHKEAPKKELRYEAPPQTNTPHHSGGHKVPKKLIFGLIGTAVGLTVFTIFMLTATPTVNLNKYTKTTFDGYNGYGNAYAEIDWDKIDRDYGKKITLTKNGKDMKDAFEEKYGSFGAVDSVQAISCAVDSEAKPLNEAKQGELSNGNKVKVTYYVPSDVEQLFRVKFKYKEKEVKVSGLSEIKSEDFFKDIKVKFSGADGSGTASIECSDETLSLYFSLDNSYDLSNGDEVTVSISDPEYLIEEYGKKPKKTSKTYKVEGLASYVKKIADLSDSAVEALKEQGNDTMRAFVANDDSYHYAVSNPEYIGMFVLDSKADSDNWNWGGANHSIVGLVYRLTATGTYDEDSSWYKKNAGLTENTYRVVTFRDLLIDENGELTEEIGNDGSLDSADHSSELLDTSVDGYSSVDSAYTSIVDGGAQDWTADWSVSE